MNNESSLNIYKEERGQVEKSKRAAKFYGLPIDEEVKKSSHLSAQDFVEVKTKASFIRSFQNPLFYKPLIVCCVINTLVGKGINFY